MPTYCDRCGAELDTAPEGERYEAEGPCGNCQDNWIVNLYENAEDKKYDAVKDDAELPETGNEVVETHFKAGFNKGVRETLNTFSQVYNQFMMKQLAEKKEKLQKLRDRVEDMDYSSRKQGILDEIDELENKIADVERKQEFLDQIHEEVE